MLNQFQKIPQDSNMLEEIINKTPCGIAVCRLGQPDFHPQFTYVSDGFCRLVGMDRADLMGEEKGGFLPHIHPDDIQHLSEIYLAAITENDGSSGEYRFVRQNGEVRWFSVTMQATKADDGAYITHGMYIDVTDKVAVKARLRADREKSYRQYKVISDVYNTLPCGIVWCTRGIRPQIHYCNQKSIELFGYASGREMTDSGKKSLMNYVHPDDVDMLTDVLRSLPEDGEKVEITFRAKDIHGRIYWLSGTVCATEIPGGKSMVQFVVVDITETRSTSEQAFLSGEAIKIAVKQKNMIFWVYDLAQRSIIRENFTHAILGKDMVVENVPQSLIDEGKIHPDDVGILLAMHDDIFAGKPTVSATLRWRTNVGEDYVWFDIIYTVIFDEHGKPIKAVGSGVDVTERILMEEKFNRQMSYKNVMEQNVVGSFHLNLTTNTASDGQSTFSDLIQLQKDGTVDGFFEEVCTRISDPDQRTAYSNLFNRKALINSFLNGTERIIHEHRFLVSQDKNIWITVHANMMRNPRTKDVEALVYAFDVNEQRVLKEMFSTIISLDYDYIIELDAKSNSYAMHFSENTPSPMPAKWGGNFEETFADFVENYVFPDDNEFSRASVKIDRILAELSDKDTYSFVVRICELDGSVSSKRIQFSYIDRHSQLILMTRSDVTKVVEKEQRRNTLLASALQAANQASIAKTDFLSRMSHEIRTPMNVIMGMNALAIQAIGDDALLLDYLKKMSSSTKFLLALINDILDMSRIEGGKMLLAQEAFLLGEIIDDVDTIITAQADIKGVAYVSRMAQAENCRYVGDKMKIQQVLVNILSNAMKFTSEGGTVTLDVTCRERPNNEVSVCFTVKDTGCGISEEFIPSLFDPFAQEHTGATSIYGGTGLGLAICKNIVELMHGTIEVHSALGQGSTFVITVHVARADAAYTAESLPAPPTNFSSFSGRRVLLVEDHPLNSEIASRLLAAAGIEVVLADNGREGVDKFLAAPAGHYDAILMDIRMPVMDGLSASRLIRSHNRPDAATVPIIAMTANVFSEDIQQTEAAGMNAHLSKPIDPQQLMETLQKFMD